MSVTASGRSRELDAVRGIAATMVLLFHYTVRYGELFSDHAAPFRVDHGFFGVELFFGVSGFVILMTLERCRTTMDFVVARGLRLYPAYWAAVAVTFAVVSLFPLAGRTSSWRQALVNLTMLQEFVGVPHVDGVYWCLEVELVFYAWMVAVLATGQLHRARTLVASWLLVSIAAMLGALALGRPSPALANRLLLVVHSAFFAIGAASFLDFRAARVSPATWCIYALALVAAWLGTGRQGLVVALLMVLLFTLLVWRKAKFLDQRVLVFLGTISYPLYLLHQNIGYVIIHALRAHAVGYGAAMLCAMAVSLAAATALTFGVERPLRRRFLAWRQQRQAVQAVTAVGASSSGTT
jgi:peptidoglycan/LPS O-acetylase OafA/YrhL